MTLQEALGKQWTDPSTQNDVQSTMSGIIAGAHLAGDQGATNLLVHDKFTTDETGTSILTYMQKFGGAYTIVDTPADDILTGTMIPEKITCGFGADLVRTGGSGNNNIFVNTSDSDSRVTVEDFNIDVASGTNDRLFFRNAETGEFSVVSSDNDTLITVHYSGGKNKEVLLRGVMSSDIDNLTDQLVLFSTDFGLKWSADGTVQTINFRQPGDFIVPGEANGIKFENILVDKTDVNNVRLRVLAADMGSYFGYELTGFTASDIRADMFSGIGGRFSDIYYGFSININDFNSSELFIIPNGWNVKQDSLFLSGWTQIFSGAAYKQVGDHVYYYPNAADDHYIVLLSTNWETDIVTSSRQVIFQDGDSWDNISLVSQKG